MENNAKQSTVDAYNNGAEQLAKKFDEIGVRMTDINDAFAAVNKINPKVLEIGCGNGRDAEEIMKRTNDYLGIDISEKMIELVLKKIPNGRFQVADIESFAFPKGLDIIFAFASLLHVPKESLKTILRQSFLALNTGGIVYLSLKYRPTYEEFIKQDEFGKRKFYFYSPNDIEEVAGQFHIVRSELQNLRGVQWLEAMLQK